MTRPRSKLIDRDIGGFYHIVSRCVRRTRLTGQDPTTGKDFSHRRSWIEARLLALTNVFAVDVLGYAVMSNHYHIVIHYRPRAGKQLADKDVARRWLTVFPPNPGDNLDELVDALAENTERIAVLRERLSDLSWYMRCLNAPIARRSNIEDECTGRFWEGRFYSKALPDVRALCMPAWHTLTSIHCVPETPTESMRRRIPHWRGARRKPPPSQSFCTRRWHQSPSTLNARASSHVARPYWLCH